MALIPRRPFRRRRDGRFEVNLEPAERDLLRSLLDQLRDLLLADDPNLHRLFPVAHADDPEQEAAYQAMAHGQLIESRFAAIDVVDASLDAKDVDEATLTGWMQSINALLVLGTMLDVGEEPLALDPDDPRAEPYFLYEVLGETLHFMVWSLSEALPEPTDDGPA